jgi:hypothetical protein
VVRKHCPFFVFQRRHFCGMAFFWADCGANGAPMLDRKAKPAIESPTFFGASLMRHSRDESV